MSSLNDRMEFDHVIQVHADGSITDAKGVYAPEVFDGGLYEDGRWTLMSGYSGQDRYSGPIMHDSEFIGGQMARDILDTPGYYVAIVSYYSPDDPDGEVYFEGWAVAYREEL